MKKLVGVLFFFFTINAFAAPDPSWFDRERAERVADYTEYSLNDFYYQVARECGSNSYMARLTDRAWQESRRLVDEFRRNADFRRLDDQFRRLNSALYDAAREYQRIPNPSRRLRDLAYNLDRDWQSLRREFRSEENQPGRLYYCVARDRGSEEHWTVINSQIVFGHVSRARNRYDAQRGAMQMCQRSHSNCILGQCWQEGRGPNN